MKLQIGNFENDKANLLEEHTAERNTLNEKIVRLESLRESVTLELENIRSGFQKEIDSWKEKFLESSGLLDRAEQRLSSSVEDLERSNQVRMELEAQLEAEGAKILEFEESFKSLTSERNSLLEASKEAETE